MTPGKRIERLEKRLTPRRATAQPAETEEDIARLWDWVCNKLAQGGFDLSNPHERAMHELLELAYSRRIAAEGNPDSS